MIYTADRCSRGETVDTSGPGLCELVKEKLAATIAHADCLPDDVDIAALRREHPGVGWHTFEGWAKEQDWSVLE